jgi:predicted O-methyltransferase YrrM
MTTKHKTNQLTNFITNKQLKMIDLEEKVKAVLDEYHKRIDTETAIMAALPIHEGMKRRDEFLLSVGKETGIFLNTLVKSAKPKTILELGTSYGYSTIWLAEAAKTYGGHVITLEHAPEKAAYAQKQIEKAGLSDFVTIKIGDALDSISDIGFRISGETLSEIRNPIPEIDFVLLDIWKELYIPCFDLFFPKLNKNAWVLADNMIFPPHSQPEALAYRKRVRETNAFDTVLLPIGSGIEMSFLKGV